MTTSFTVLFFLALFNFLASIIQGLTGFGDAVILHVMWYTASVISPEVFNTTPLGNEPVRAITLLMYVRIIFSAPLVAILSFKDGIFSKTMTIAMAIPSTLTAIGGVYLFANMNGNQLKLVLGLSCLIFAILYCVILVSRYAMKQRRVRVWLSRVRGYCAPLLAKFTILKKGNTTFSNHGDKNEEPTIITTIPEESMQPSESISNINNNAHHMNRSSASHAKGNSNNTNKNTSCQRESETTVKVNPCEEELIERSYRWEMIKLTPNVVVQTMESIPHNNHKTNTEKHDAHVQDDSNRNTPNDSDNNTTKHDQEVTSVNSLCSTSTETDREEEQLQKSEQLIQTSSAHVEFSEPSPNSTVHTSREEKPNDVHYSIVHPVKSTAITGTTDALLTTGYTDNRDGREDCTLQSECGSPFTLHEAHTPAVMEASQPIPPLTPSKLSPTRSMMYTRVRINRNLDESGKVKRTTKIGASFAAALSGIMGSLTGVGAPPQIIFVLLFDVPQYIIRVNFCIQSIPSAAFRFIVACTTPLFTWTMVPMFIVAVLFGYAGIFFGNYLGKMMGPKGYSVFVLSLLLVASLIMMTTNVAVLIISTLLCVAVSVFATWWEWRETHRQAHITAQSVTILTDSNNTIADNNSDNVHELQHHTASSVITIHDDNNNVAEKIKNRNDEENRGRYTTAAVTSNSLQSSLRGQHSLQKNQTDCQSDINMNIKESKKEKLDSNTRQQPSSRLITPPALQTQYNNNIVTVNTASATNDNDDDDNSNVSSAPKEYSTNPSFNYSNENTSFYSNDTNSHKPRRVRRAELHRPPSLFLEQENSNNNLSSSLTSQAIRAKKSTPLSLLQEQHVMKSKQNQVNLSNAHSNKHHTKEESNTGHDGNSNSGV